MSLSTSPKPRRVLYGGSFDPFHRGHRSVVEALLAWGADEVWVLPAARSPFKEAPTAAPDADRLEMCRLGTRDLVGVRVSDADLRRPAPSFAIDTVREMQTGHPGGSWWWALGSEHLPTLGDWRDIDKLATMVRFAVIARLDENDSGTTGGSEGWGAGPATGTQSAKRDIGLPDGLPGGFPIGLSDRLDRIPMAPVPTAATRIRLELATTGSSEEVAPEVMDLIRTRGLYRNRT